MKPLPFLLVLLLPYANCMAQKDSLENFSHVPGAASIDKNPFPAKIFIGAGTAFNSLKITGNDSYYETQIDHESAISFAVVAGVQFPIRSTKGALLISPRIHFYSLDAKGEADLQSGLANFHHESSIQSNLIIKPAAVIGYNFINQPAFKCYVAAGPGFQFFAGAEEQQITTFESGQQIKTENKPQPMVFVVDAEAGGSFGQHIGIMLNYQPPANIFKYVSKKVLLSTLQATLTWSF